MRAGAVAVYICRAVWVEGRKGGSGMEGRGPLPLRSLIYSSGEKRGGGEAEETGFVPRPAGKSTDDNTDLSWPGRASLLSKSGKDCAFNDFICDLVGDIANRWRVVVY